MAGASFLVRPTRMIARAKVFDASMLADVVFPRVCDWLSAQVVVVSEEEGRSGTCNRRLLGASRRSTRRFGMWRMRDGTWLALAVFSAPALKVPGARLPFGWDFR